MEPSNPEQPVQKKEVSIIFSDVSGVAGAAAVGQRLLLGLRLLIRQQLVRLELGLRHPRADQGRPQKAAVAEGAADRALEG